VPKAFLIIAGVGLIAALGVGGWFMFGDHPPAPMPADQAFVPPPPASQPESKFGLLRDAQTLSATQATPAPPVAADDAQPAAPQPESKFGLLHDAQTLSATQATPVPPVAEQVPAPAAADNTQPATPMPPPTPVAPEAVADATSPDAVPEPKPTPAAKPAVPRPARARPTPLPTATATPTQTAIVPPPPPLNRFDGTYAGRTVAHGCQSDRFIVTVSGTSVSIRTSRGAVQGTLAPDGSLKLSGYETPTVPTQLSVEGRFSGSDFAGSGTVSSCQFDFKFAKN
jgi:hypothetical protein